MQAVQALELRAPILTSTNNRMAGSLFHSQPQIAYRQLRHASNVVRSLRQKTKEN